MGESKLMEDVGMAKCLARSDQWIARNPSIDVTDPIKRKEMLDVWSDINRELRAYRTERGGGVLLAQGMLRRCYDLEQKGESAKTPKALSHTEVEVFAVARGGENTLAEIGRTLFEVTTDLTTLSTPEKIRFLKDCGNIQQSLDVVNRRFDLFSKLEADGVLNHDVLFPRGGSHEQRRKEVLEFTVWRREQRQASVKGMGENEKREAYWVSLTESGETYEADLKDWRRRKDMGKAG